MDTLRRFSHYRVIAPLGQGGMGEVRLAEDLSLDRKVALKFLRADVGAAAPGRLLHEARAAAHLDHPFICKVYEVGEHDGAPFLAMEYVQGTTLRERLDTSRLAVADVVRIASEIAEAVHFAHTRGIIHRDLKPANVMVTDDGHVKVMDFGISKRVTAPLAPDAATATGSTVVAPGPLTGTPAYMSPEQISGATGDARSDVFAFGVLLHQMLTGTHPFVRPTVLATALAIASDPAPAPEHPDGTPPLLAHIVSRCLEKKPERRYQTMGEVRQELEALLAPVPVQPGRTVHRWRRRAAAIAAAAVIALAGVVHWKSALPFLGTEPALAFKERDWIVVADFNNLTGDKVFDTSLRLALEVAIGQSQHVNVYPPDRVGATLRRMNRRGADPLDAGLASEVALREGIRAVLACDIAQVGGVYSITARLIDPHSKAAVLTDSVRADRKDHVLDALGRLAERLRSSLGESLTALSDRASPLPQVTTTSLDALKLYADSLRLTGASSAGAKLELLRQALVLDPDFALAHAELGRRYYLLSERSNREAGEQHLTKALALTARLTVRERLWIAANAEDARGNRERAVDAFKSYLAQYPDDAAAVFRLAWTQMAGLKQFPDAIAGFKRYVQLNPQDPSGYVNLATAYTGVSDFSTAVGAYERAFALDPVMTLGIFINHEYGFTLVQIGKVDEAAAVFTRMKQEADDIHKAKGFRSLALLYMYLGRYAAAAEELRGAIALNQTHRAPVSEFRDRLFLISALEARGRRGEADAEWAALDRLIASLSLSPDWLYRALKMKASHERVAEARRLLVLMQKTAGDATADASVARNTGHDRPLLALAEAEIELAAGRTGRAVELAEAAHAILKWPESLAALARAYVAAGRLAEAVGRYEELMARPHLGYEGQEDWLQAHVALAQLYERMDRRGDAERLYRSLIDRCAGGDQDLVLLNAAHEGLRRVGARQS